MLRAPSFWRMISPDWSFRSKILEEVTHCSFPTLIGAVLRISFVCLRGQLLHERQLYNGILTHCSRKAVAFFRKCFTFMFVFRLKLWPVGRLLLVRGPPPLALFYCYYNRPLPWKGGRGPRYRNTVACKVGFSSSSHELICSSRNLHQSRK